MEKTNNLKILNIISGASQGGAEKFFERFSISIQKQKGIEQRVIIKKNKRRCNFLRQNKIMLEELAFRSKFDFYTRKKIKRVIITGVSWGMNLNYQNITIQKNQKKKSKI